MKNALLASLLFFTAAPLSALENIFFTFKYGLSDFEDSFTLNKHTFGFDTTADTGDNLKPKFDFSYVNVAEKGDGVDFLMQFSANVLYEATDIYYSSLIPYAYGGIGYEYVNNEREGFSSAPYVQIGAGLEFPFFDYTNDDFKLIAEGRWIQLISSEGGQDSEAAIFIGFRISTGGFGYSSGESYDVYDYESGSKYAELDGESAPEISYNNSLKKRQLFSDTDGDGVKDEIDRCANTPRGTAVDAIGCPIARPVGYKIKKLKTKKITFKPLPREVETIEVMFEPNSANITTDSKVKIRQSVERLNSRGYRHITIEGYTDNSGTHAQNIALSTKRANTVKELMVLYGIDSSKITAVGKGELNPIADNDTPEGRAKNRRIEIVVE